MRLRVVALAFALVTASRSAIADDAAKGRAREDFDAGKKLYAEGRYERALDYFLRAREHHPPAIGQAATTLYRLGRLDEAYALYRELVRRFPNLKSERRAEVDEVMGKIAARIATIQLTSNVLGMVVADGRAQGRLPLAEPVPVMPGERVVRVIHDGYVTFEQVARVRAGERLSFDAILKPLAESGELEVSDPANVGSTVFVDRAPLGTTPWRGTLGPGEHVVWTGRGDAGSAPVRVVVVQGQRVTLTARSADLGPPIRIAITPPTAVLTLDGVPLGAGTWEGKLPIGSYSLVASEPGYKSEARTLTIPTTTGASETIGVRVALRVEPLHPRWPRPLQGSPWLEVFGGPMIAPSLHGGPDDCTSCKSVGPALGLAVAARAGYRFPFGMSLEFMGGYAMLSSRTNSDEPSNHRDIRFRLTDEARIHGGMFAAGVSQRARLGRLFFQGRAAIGALVSRVSTASSGSATGADGEVNMWLTSSPHGATGGAPLVQSEMSIGARFGKFEIGVTAGAIVLLLAGPKEANQRTVIEKRCPPEAGCIRTDEAIGGARAAHRAAIVFTPQVGLGYAW